MNKETRKTAGPTFFSGSGEQFVNLSEALSEAKRWIEENCKNPEEWTTVHRIVGCL